MHLDVYRQSFDFRVPPLVEESARCGKLASGRGGGLGGGHDVMRGMRDGGREQGAQTAGER